MGKHKHDGKKEGCMVCEAQKDFEFPPGFIDEVLSREVIIFAGAGISTENPLVTQRTLYDHLSFELGLEESGISFPDLAEKYSRQVNGQIKLIEKIDERLETFFLHDELYLGATSFHRELATIPCFDTIITTNWDEFFERECHAKPFVNSKDIAFWKVAKRRVLKIHGTINNFGSLVATRTQYEECLKELRENLIGGKLKELLATKTVVYIGYSLRDPDFLELADFVNQQMEGFQKQSYVVALESTPEMEKRLGKLNLQVIETEGTFFISEIKEQVQKIENCMLPDIIYNIVASFLEETLEANEKLYSTYNIHDNPEIIYCSCYQDGLVHGLKRILKIRPSGLPSDIHYVQSVVRGYEDLIKKYRKSKNYYDLSYLVGYQNAYLALLIFADEGEYFPPLFYGAGDKEAMEDFDCFQELLPEIPSWNKTAQKKAILKVGKIEKNKTNPIRLKHPCEL